MKMEGKVLEERKIKECPECESKNGDLRPGRSGLNSKEEVQEGRSKKQLLTRKKRFVFALSEIDRMSSALGLPRDIKEGASGLYHKARKKQLTKGRSIEEITSAILYITCRQYGVPRTLKEIKAVSKVGQKEIGRAYRFLLRELSLKLSPTSPVEFVPRFCSKLGLDEEVRIKAIEIIKEAMEKELANGRNPIGIAAAAIYIAVILYGKQRTQKEVSDVTGVTEVTIRNIYPELIKELGIKYPFLSKF